MAGSYSLLAEAPDLSCRQTYLTFLLSVAWQEAALELTEVSAAVLSQLLPEITAALNTEVTKDPRVSLPLAQLWALLPLKEASSELQEAGEALITKYRSTVR